MTVILFHLLRVLLYLIAALLILHLSWKALTSRRIAAWYQFAGVALLTVCVVARAVHPAFKAQTENGQTKISGPDQPYWSILQGGQATGALLILVGLGTEVQMRVNAALRKRRAKQTKLEEPN